jgi:hypothetical protein
LFSIIAVIQLPNTGTANAGPLTKGSSTVFTFPNKRAGETNTEDAGPYLADAGANGAIRLSRLLKSDKRTEFRNPQRESPPLYYSSRLAEGPW